MNVLLTFSRANLLNGLKPATRFAALATLLMAVFLLVACGGGGGSSSGSGGASGIQVTNLKAIPGSGSLTLTWDNPNANISSFNIDVYDLDTNATNNRVAAASQANITIATSPAVNTTAPLATARYTITSGLLNDSNYSVAVTVNLQGADAGRATSARGLSGRRYLPANGVRIGANTDEDQYADSVDNCPAIKNDDQANTYGGADNIGDVCGDIDNDDIVDADDNCAVVANTDQLDTNGNGMGDVCDSALDSDGDSIANDRDNCPLIASPNQEDGDRDNVGDICDVDDDGDGLIEISTAAELNMMRNNLNGTGLDDGTSDNDNNTGGISNGCGGLNSITTCNGYEQMANIDLNDLNAVPGEANWEPTGRCTNDASANICGSNDSQYFSAKFNGNDYTINNMRIIVTVPATGIGFFGGTLAGSELRNIHIHNGSINASIVVQNVGGLVGEAVDTRIISSSATMARVSGRSNIGGLVGRSGGATIVSSYAIVDELFAIVFNGGGLVGNFGALAGAFRAHNIISSVAIIGKANVDLYGGGFFGEADSANLNSSYTVVSRFMGSQLIGGLVGRSAGGIRINASYVVVNNSIAGNGGLVGSEEASSTGRASASATNSYWDTTTLTPSANLSLPINSIGTGQSTNALQSGTSTSAGTNSIFSEWSQGYCNPATGEYRATAPSPLGDYIRAWDLGTSTEYPALNCFSTFSPAQQRETAARALRGETLVE